MYGHPQNFGITLKYYQRNSSIEKCHQMLQAVLHMSLITTKPVQGFQPGLSFPTRSEVSNQVRLGFTAIEDGKRLEISGLGSREVVLPM